MSEDDYHRKSPVFDSTLSKDNNTIVTGFQSSRLPKTGSKKNIILDDEMDETSTDNDSEEVDLVSTDNEGDETVLGNMYQEARERRLGHLRMGIAEADFCLNPSQGSDSELSDGMLTGFATETGTCSSMTSKISRYSTVSGRRVILDNSGNESDSTIEADDSIFTRPKTPSDLGSVTTDESLQSNVAQKKNPK